LSICGTVTNTCPENATGSIALDIQGGVTRPDFLGVSPYAISWNTSINNANAPSSLAPGNYCVTVTDYCGTSVTECFDVIIEPSLIFDVFPTSLDHGAMLFCNGN